MRMRKHPLGMTAAVASCCLVFAGSAQAAGTLTGQTVDATVVSKPQDRKVLGPVGSLTVAVDTTYDGLTPPFTGRATNTKIDFPGDSAVRPPKAQCDPNAGGFSSSTTAGALALCGDAQVGTGNATLLGPVPGVTAVVTAFNGTQPEGLPTILLHARTVVPATTTVLIGTIRRSDQGPLFGPVLDVPIPLLIGGNFVVSHFETTIPQLKTVPANKKKRKPAQYYLMITCSKKEWNLQARSTFDGGAPPTLATDRETCKQKKSKKKKKK